MQSIFKGVQKRHPKNGFTLLELMIVMAIMMLFITFIFGTFYIVNASHARVAVLDDAKELATLDMNAIENLIINGNDIVITNDTAALPGYTVITFNANSELTYNGTVAFPFQQYTINTASANKNKWDVSATFVRNAAGNAVDVTITLKDRSKNPSSPPVYYKLSKTILLLNVKNLAGSQITSGITGSTIKCKSATW